MEIRCTHTLTSVMCISSSELLMTINCISYTLYATPLSQLSDYVLRTLENTEERGKKWFTIMSIMKKEVIQLELNTISLLFLCLRSSLFPAPAARAAMEGPLPFSWATHYHTITLQLLLWTFSLLNSVAFLWISPIPPLFTKGILN
jgi:hypothetical protein